MGLQLWHVAAMEAAYTAFFQDSDSLARLKAVSGLSHHTPEVLAVSGKTEREVVGCEDAATSRWPAEIPNPTSRELKTLIVEVRFKKRRARFDRRYLFVMLLRGTHELEWKAAESAIVSVLAHKNVLADDLGTMSLQLLNADEMKALGMPQGTVNALAPKVRGMPTIIDWELFTDEQTFLMSTNAGNLREFVIFPKLWLMVPDSVAVAPISQPSVQLIDEQNDPHRHFGAEIQLPLAEVALPEQSAAFFPSNVTVLPGAPALLGVEQADPETLAKITQLAMRILDTLLTGTGNAERAHANPEALLTGILQRKAKAHRRAASGVIIPALGEGIVTLAEAKSAQLNLDHWNTPGPNGPGICVATSSNGEC